jgi:acetate kinase
VRILTVNVGSSSTKLRALDARDGVLLDHELPPLNGDGTRQLDQALDAAPAVDAVAHRIVHGGSAFRAPVVVDDGVLAHFTEVRELAPLHNGPAITALSRARERLALVPHVACFDTAFHAGMPPEATALALPRAWVRRFGLRRYGFHGLSHAYASRRAAELLRRPLDGLRVVTCHLGAGASLSAVAGGRSLDTTMGFSTLDGLVMATRCGAVDPGALLWAQRKGAIGPHDAERALAHEAGLLALAGTDDMRTILRREAKGDGAASHALAVYLHRLRAGIAAMAAALEGIDALVFTGGVGERAPEIRARACRGLGFLGVDLDETANAMASEEDALLGGNGAARVLVVAAREDLEMARGARRALRDARP